MKYPTKGKQPQTCQGDWRQRHSPRQKKQAPRYGGCHLGAYQEEERPGVEGKEGVGSQANAPPPSPARVVVAAQDNMAAAFRRPSHVLLFTLQSSVSPGVGGSGSTCCRCPLGAKRYLLTDNVVKLKEFQHKKVVIANHLPGTKGALEVLIEMKNQDVKFNKETYVLAFAICYKLNSPESLKICTTLREEALIKGEVLSRRASCFAVALALNQNQVAKAISIFSQIMKPESIICTNLNILIHIQSNMLKTLIKILKDAADGNLSKFVKRQEFSEEVLAKARKKVKDVPTLLAKFDEIYGKLHINGQVTTCTLDTLLCHTPGDRKSHMVLLSKRTVSHRTFQPLNQSLWAE
uniref:Pentatricopeptide repeat domain 2 n=1 Tax=Lynx canadensis TaxID=61383 RepID=A0A667GL75_LYNCA